MKSKIRTIIVLGFIGVVVLTTALIIVLNGSKNGGFNYARIDYSASIEFVTDNKNNIVSYRPLNDNGRLVLAGVDIDGRKINPVVKEIMEESFKMGLFDLTKTVIPINLTTIGRITHSFDIKVYEAINDFLVENQLMGIIIENTNDKETATEAKKIKVSANELKLIESVVHDTDISKEDLSKKMPDELIDIIMDIDDEYMKNNPIGNTEINEKNIYIDEYKSEYEKHINSISKDSARNYMEARTDRIREYRRKLELGVEVNG